MPGIFLSGKGEPALIDLKNSFFDEDAGVDWLVYFKGVVAIVSDDAKTGPSEVGSGRFTGVCEFEALNADLIVFVGQVDDDGGKLFADKDCIGLVLVDLYSDSFLSDLISFLIESCFYFDNRVRFGVG